ncbi:MAG: hypothetical protein J7M18_05990 [Candidatus Eremiobacteraeota bacterium]|nr:hypothetical protein [Candidatus Eremiobacteraeota bacterium]
MFKNKCFLFFPLILLCLATIAGAKISYPGCGDRIELVVRALNLWAQNHNGLFPTTEQYWGEKFDLYMKKVGLSNSGRICPGAHKPFIYIPSKNRKSFTLSCPRPEVHGYLTMVWYSGKGLVYEKMTQPYSTAPVWKGTGKENIVTAKDRKAIFDIIRRLHNAYATKNLEEVLKIQAPAIELSAVKYEEEGKGTKEQVWDAFRGCTAEILDHPNFEMKPLDLENVGIECKGDLYTVTGNPIMFSSEIRVMSAPEPQPMRVRVGEMLFKKKSGGFELIRMSMY